MTLYAGLARHRALRAPLPLLLESFFTELKYIFIVYTATGEGGQADDCTNGFMSLERMNQVIGNFVVGANWDRQVIVPEINFTCSGRVQTLMFGTSWFRDYTQYPEFQIWRPLEGEDNVYQLVGQISVENQQQVSGQIYQLQGESLLQFEPGDILGFNQPARDDSRSRIRLAVRMPQPLQTMYRRNGNSNANFDISTVDSWRRNLLVSVITG